MLWYLFVWLLIWHMETSMAKMFDDARLYENDILKDDDEQPGLSKRDGGTPVMWTNGVVPYGIGKDEPPEAKRPFQDDHLKLLFGMMRLYETHTCVRFRPYAKGDKHYLAIMHSENGETNPYCGTLVGMKKGGQKLILDERCFTDRVVLHELGHALGLHHEQTRPDRDDHIRIDWNNVKNTEEGKDQFKTHPHHPAAMTVGYDPGSLMHYYASEMAVDKNKPVLTAINPKWENWLLGNTVELTKSDTLKVLRMYDCCSSQS